MRFADRLQKNIERTKSYLVAGFDPVIENIPQFIRSNSQNQEQQLCQFFETSLEAIHGLVPAIKPNIAFFEQYGMQGLRTLSWLLVQARSMGFVTILDAKRGDIGTTAAAYSAAYLRPALSANKGESFEVDSITVNPFLGFDTIDPYLKDCIEYNKGIFVLVKTSNPGSASIQDLKIANNRGASNSISETIADWIAEHANQLAGTCGYSGLGAVVGATYPQQAQDLRSRMPNSFFLIPGLGAQGGSAQEAIAGFSKFGENSMKGAALVNVSRGLFAGLPTNISDAGQLKSEIISRANKFNSDINQALAT